MGEGNKILALCWPLTDLNTMADYRVEGISFKKKKDAYTTLFGRYKLKKKGCLYTTLFGRYKLKKKKMLIPPYLVGISFKKKGCLYHPIWSV